MATSRAQARAEIEKPKKTYGITAFVIKYFSERIGQEVFIEDLVKDSSFNEDQIRAAINNLNSESSGDGTFKINVVIRGRVYRYAGTKVTEEKPAVISKRMFEEVGVTKKGTIVVQDESGNLYEATEL